MRVWSVLKVQHPDLSKGDKVEITSRKIPSGTEKITGMVVQEYTECGIPFLTIFADEEVCWSTRITKVLEEAAPCQS